MGRGKPRANITGEQYGKLTAIHYVKAVPGGSLWRVRCECGTELDKRLCDLRDKRNRNQDCGCGSAIDPAYWRRIKQKSREKNRRAGVYFILAEEVNRVKIGYTGHIKDRLSNMQKDSPVKLQLYYFLDNWDEELEQLLHRYFSKYHFKGEWFEFSDEMKKFFEKATTS